MNLIGFTVILLTMSNLFLSTLVGTEKRESNQLLGVAWGCSSILTLCGNYATNAEVKVLHVKLICAKLLWSNDLVWAWLTEFSLHSVASLWQKPFYSWFLCCYVILVTLHVLPSPWNCSTCKLWSYDYPSYIYVCMCTYIWVSLVCTHYW